MLADLQQWMDKGKVHIAAIRTRKMTITGVSIWQIAKSNWLTHNQDHLQLINFMLLNWHFYYPQSDPYAKAKLAKLFDCKKRLHITKATWKLSDQKLN